MSYVFLNIRHWNSKPR